MWITVLILIVGLVAAIIFSAVILARIGDFFVEQEALLENIRDEEKLT